jgi:O-antigen ligase
MNPRRALTYSISALAFSLPLSIAAANASLVATTLCLLWLLAAQRREALSALKETARSPAFLALSACTVWALVSCLAGRDPAASLHVWSKDVHKMWAFLAIGAALAAAEGMALSLPFAAGLGLHAVAGIWQAARDWAAGMERVRAHGFLHPVSYAELMGLGAIGAAVYLARGDGGGARRRGAGLLLVLATAAVVLSQTRAVLVALVAAYAAACLLIARWRKHVLAAALVVAAVVSFWEVMPTQGRSLRNLFTGGGKTSAHRARLELWGVALEIARDHPLAGVGPGRYRETFEAYHPARIDNEGTWGNAHNVYLHQLAERGIPGLCFLLAAMWAFWIGAWRAARARGDMRSLWAVSAAAAFFVMNLTEVAWQTEQVATFFFFIWHLGTSPRPAREIL